jgi:hypothetical protein
MKTIDELLALQELFPKYKSESPMSWMYRAKNAGLFNEEDLVSAFQLVRNNLYLWIN